MNDVIIITRNWNNVNGQSNANYSAGNEIIYSAEILRSNICDYNDFYILVKSNITIIGCNLSTEVALENSARFIKFITKIVGTAIDDTKDLDLVMEIYNLLKIF